VPTINYLAVALATLANMMLGAVWYGVFGEAWLKGLHKRKEDLDPKDPTPYLVALGGSLLNALALAVLLQYVQVESLTHGLWVGAAAGTLLTAASMAKHYSFSRWPAQLFGIDAGVDIVGYIVMSAILTLLR